VFRKHSTALKLMVPTISAPATHLNSELEANSWSARPITSVLANGVSAFAKGNLDASPGLT